MHFQKRARDHNAVIFVRMFLQTPQHIAPFADNLAVVSAMLSLASFGETIRADVYNVLECFGVFFVGEL